MAILTTLPVKKRTRWKNSGSYNKIGFLCFNPLRFSKLHTGEYKLWLDICISPVLGKLVRAATRKKQWVQSSEIVICALAMTCFHTQLCSFFRNCCCSYLGWKCWNPYVEWNNTKIQEILQLQFWWDKRVVFSFPLLDCFWNLVLFDYDGKLCLKLWKETLFTLIKL